MGHSLNSHRLDIIKNHLSMNQFEFTEDLTLSMRRSMGASINKPLLFQCYFGSIHTEMTSLRALAVSSVNFDHAKESQQKYPQQQGNTLLQIADLYLQENCTYEDDLKNPLKKLTMMYVFAEYDKALTTRILVHAVLYIDTLQSLGTEKHVEAIKRAYSLEDYGCFAMTELGHGSNIMHLETTAVYLKASQEFVINSPTATSAKWWIGAAGKTANMAVVFAQLIVNTEKKGVHAFLVKIRNKSHRMCPGVVAGDCGPKISLDRIDNGFLIFSDFRAPYDSLLDRFSFITIDGRFNSFIKNSEKRLGAMMGGLIRGRGAVCSSSEINLRSSTTIALRFASTRIASFPEGKKSILDNPLYYSKLIPCLSYTLAMRAATKNLLDVYCKNHMIYKEDPESEELSELHATLSSIKVMSSWLCMESLQVILEMCGRFALYQNSSLSRLRDNHDINVTWEGDNTVLIQQVGKYALKHMQRSFKGHPVTSKTLSVLFISANVFPNIKCKITEKSANLSEELLKGIKYKFNYFLNKSIERLQEMAPKSESMLETWNNSQVFYIQELGKSFGEYIMARDYFEFCKEVEAGCAVTGKEIRKLANLFCVERLLVSLPVLQEKYLTNDQVDLLRNLSLQLCNDLKDSAVNIIEALAPPDKLLYSDIGGSNGQLYENIYKKLS